MSTDGLFDFYLALLNEYGPQGWWPIREAGVTGYHPGDYSYPRTRNQCFEICVGAILTQNTSWTNVEKSLEALHSAGMMSPDTMSAAPPEALSLLIRSAGYFNQKTRKLTVFADYFALRLWPSPPSRQALLSLWGIGPETADSIRLYAFGQREMVMDAYTQRVLSGHGWVAKGADYETAKAFCVAELPREVGVYQEFHALMVAHAKRHYRGK